MFFRRLHFNIKKIAFPASAPATKKTSGLATITLTWAAVPVPLLLLCIPSPWYARMETGADHETTERWLEHGATGLMDPFPFPSSYIFRIQILKMQIQILPLLRDNYRKTIV